MDRKSIIVLVISFILLLAWYPLVVNKLYPPKPLPRGTNAPSMTVGGTNPPTPLAGTSAVPTLEASAPAAVTRPGANAREPEELLEVTNAIAHYTFTSHGGGLKLVELLHYKESVPTFLDRKLQTTNVATLNHSAHTPTLEIFGNEGLHGDGVFKLTRTAEGVRAEKALTNGLVIVKDFHIGTNYLLAATVRLENHGAAPLNLPAQEWVVGTATPMSARDDGQAVGVLWYDGSRSADVNVPWFANRSFGCVAGTPHSEFRGGASNVVWVAAHNQFFTLVAMPQNPGQEVVVRKITLPRPTGDEAALVATNAPPPEGLEAALVYPAQTLAPGQSVQRNIQFFAGPKEYRTLANLAASLNNNVDLVMGYTGPFGFVAKGLLLAMNWLHEALRFSYGWAIVAITIIIKLVFWPLTQASTRSMKRMQALQPQMKALQEKYKDDPAKMNKKLMEFMREHKVSPLGGCLPMLLQIPVFFGFFSMIRSAIELRGAHFLWVSDLTQPDTFYIISGLGFIPFIGIPGVGLPLNLLPLIMGATMLWQAHLTPPSPGMDPAQAKIMRYMPLMFMVFLYRYSAGLTLYWTVQNLLTIAQTKLTRTQPETAAPVLTPELKKRK
jgi:YidC/Oxa1 family membrane protein insertase